MVMPMEQIRNYGDERQTSKCVHCAGVNDSIDHVPSKVLLDEPYPENLPGVPACSRCNQSFSMDEEYLACLIECTLAGSVNPDDMERVKIKRIVRERPALASRLTQARRETPQGITFEVESERVRNVLLKLARGHAAFELNEPQFDEPLSVNFCPLPMMGRAERETFEALSQIPKLSIWPEVGSRAMQRMVIGSSDSQSFIFRPGWISVQSGRYRYLAAAGNGVVVRMVFSEYLAGEAVWE